MKITLNGKQEDLDVEISLEDFLNLKGLGFEKIVVEYNYNILKKEEWSGITVKENDNLEIVRFVGGG